MHTVKQLAEQMIKNIEEKQNSRTDNSSIIALHQLKLILSIETMTDQEIITAVQNIRTCIVEIEKGKFGLSMRNSVFLQKTKTFLNAAVHLIPEKNLRPGILTTNNSRQLFEDLPNHGTDMWYHLAKTQSYSLADVAKRKEIDIDQKNSEGITALQYAVAEGDILATTFLIANGADVKITNEQGYTLLHLAASRGYLHLVSLLKKYDIELNRDKDIPTPLMLAIQGQYEDVALQLVPGCISYYENVVKSAPESESISYEIFSSLNLAIKNNLKQVEFALRAPLTMPFNIPPTETIKDFQREQKKSVTNRAPFNPILSDKEIKSPEAIESQIFIDETPEIPSLLKGRLTELYSNAPVLQPLLDMMGFSALGLHSKESKNKHFKIIIASKEKIEKMRIRFNQPNSKAFYTDKNTIFISYDPHYEKGIFEVMMHEAAHFIMNIVFENKCNPFYENDADARNKMHTIVNVIKDRFANAIDLNNKDARFIKCYNTIRSVFINYEEKSFSQELIVRVPEIIAMVGYEKGQAWLQENVPELLEYYKTYVNDALRETLKKRNTSTIACKLRLFSSTSSGSEGGVEPPKNGSEGGFEPPKL